MPPRKSKAPEAEASTSRRRRREPSPPPPPPPPSPLPWELPDPAHVARYNLCNQRVIVPSKFFDAFTIHRLGLHDAVTQFLNNIGWNHFASLNFPTYRSITLEIMSTISTTYHAHSDDDPPCISFRCMGEAHHLTIGEFNALFGFPNDGLNWQSPTFFPTQAWRQLTGREDYNPSSSKSTLIRNPALRYIHRVMTVSIFSRGQSCGVVSKLELLFLWAMQNAIPINTGAFFIKHLMHLARLPTAKIRVGGVLSIIADAYGFVPIENIHPVIPGSTLVDIDTLIHMKLCRHLGGGLFRLLDDQGHVINPPEDYDTDDPPVEEPLHAPPDTFDDTPTPPPAPPSDDTLVHILARLENLEMHQQQSDELHQHMLTLLQQTMEATARIEDKLANLK